MALSIILEISYNQVLKSFPLFQANCAQEELSNAMKPLDKAIFTFQAYRNISRESCVFYIDSLTLDAAKAFSMSMHLGGKSNIIYILRAWTL